MTQVSSEMCTTSGSQDGQTLVRKPLDNCNYNYNVDARNAKCLYISHLVSVNYYASVGRAPRYTVVVLCVSPSVRPSVCLSVRLYFQVTFLHNA